MTVKKEYMVKQMTTVQKRDVLIKGHFVFVRINENGLEDRIRTKMTLVFVRTEINK